MASQRCRGDGAHGGATENVLTVGSIGPVCLKTRDFAPPNVGGTVMTDVAAQHGAFPRCSCAASLAPLARLIEIGEQVRVQHFLAGTPIEAPDEGVL